VTAVVVAALAPSHKQRDVADETTDDTHEALQASNA
jgi:hypothetical protein